MALPDRNNPYNFDEFLAWRRNIDYYRDDAFIGKGFHVLLISLKN